MTGDIIFIGPPGGGKGTVGQIIDRAGLARHVSTGDLCRDYLKSVAEDDPIHARIAAGEFLNDDEITALLARRVSELPDVRMIIDGYPRSLDQVKLLDRILAKYDREIGAVISFEMTDERVVERISGRYVCRACAHVYHRTFNPAPDNVCACGETQFITREDDRPAVIGARLYRYHHRTEPVIAHYKARGLIRALDCDRPIEVVANATLDLVQ